MMEGKERQAVIAEIQRFCIHDGPGIRTTVFSKAVLCPAAGATIRKPRKGNRRCFSLRTAASAAKAVRPSVKEGPTAGQKRDIRWIFPGAPFAGKRRNAPGHVPQAP